MPQYRHTADAPRGPWHCDRNVGPVVDDDDVQAVERSDQACQPCLVVLERHDDGDVGRRRDGHRAWVPDARVEQFACHESGLRVGHFDETVADHRGGRRCKLEHSCR